MKFQLRDGKHTTVFFYRNKEGKTMPFPPSNADIVRELGSKEAKETLEQILKDGVSSLRDRMYVAFMGPPIPPYKMRCYCGHFIKVGHDERGYYIEGAHEIIFEPREKPHEEERESRSRAED